MSMCSNRKDLLARFSKDSVSRAVLTESRKRRLYHIIPCKTILQIDGDDIYHHDPYFCVRSRTFDCGESFFSCPVSDDFLGPGKKPKYLSSYPYLHLSSWVRSLQHVDPSLLEIILLGSVFVFLAFLGLELGVRKQLR